MTQETDHELLELAAKAAGIKAEWHYGCGDALHLTAPNANAIYWNPLRDDGDALRLAVKLKLTVVQDLNEPVCAVYWTDVQCVNIAHKDDPHAATRRAIVRAAAEIGKAM